ncbi:MAG: M48 family metalloprotease [Treponema sp.]|nr:M48 family metalloprotease [Treponema sp.]
MTKPNFYKRTGKRAGNQSKKNHSECRPVNRPRFFALFALFALLFGMIFVSCQSLGKLGEVLAQDEDSTIATIGQGLVAVAKANEEISPEMEYYIGRSVAAAITKTYPIYKKAPKTTEYLNKICNTLVINSKTPYLYRGYHVVILDTDEINAMATPGGHIFVSKGLIKSTDSEDSLAAVLAHEISHIQLKHSIVAIRASRGADAFSKFGKVVGMIATDAAYTELANMSESEWIELGLSQEEIAEIKEITSEFMETEEEMFKTLVNSGFSQEQEFDADDKALDLMADSGYDPKAMLDMLNLISGNSSEGGWNATHPSAEERIENINSVIGLVDFEGQPKSVRQKRFEKMTADIR